MLHNQETIKNIKSLGLNTYEVKIWTALLSRGVSTAGELSDIANVPRSRSYDVLESLEKKGFVIVKLGKPINYVAVPPKEVLDRVKGKIEKQSKSHISKISSTGFTDLINKLQQKHDQATKLQGSVAAVIKGSGNLRKHLEYLFKHANTEINIATNTERKDHYLTTYVDKARASVSIRTNHAGMRMIAVDGKETVIFPLHEKEVHPDYDVGIWIRNKALSQFLQKLLTSA